MAGNWIPYEKPEHLKKDKALMNEEELKELEELERLEQIEQEMRSELSSQLNQSAYIGTMDDMIT